jgi:hypothetical protein
MEIKMITEINKKVFDDLIYDSKRGKEELLMEEFNKNFPNFKSEIKILAVLYGKELCKDDFEVLDLGFSFKSFNVLRKRLKEKNLIAISKIDGKKEFYKITKEGKEFLKYYFKNEFIFVNDYILENIKKSRKLKEELNLEDESNLKTMIQNVFNLISNKPDIQKAIQEGSFKFDLLEISELEPDVCDSLLNNFEETKELFKLFLKEHLIGDEKEFEEIKDNIKFYNLEEFKTQNYKISSIPKDSKELI